jgi:YD repeat-containing protein
LGIFTISGLPIFGSLVQFSCEDGSTPASGTCDLDMSDEDKDKSDGDPDDCVGNPCNAANGNKFEVETDYVGTGPFPLALRRFHNARTPSSASAFGPAWLHSYGAAVQLFESPTLFTAYVIRPDGKTLYFNATAAQGPWTGDGDVSHRLVTVDQGGILKWRLTSSDGDLNETYDRATGRLESLANRAGLVQTLQYDASSRLESVSDPFGRALTFAYNAQGRIASVTDPALNQITYQYDPQQGNLAIVSYPGSPIETKSYTYGDSRFPHALTEIMDENSVTFAAWEYDENGRAISSQHAGGAERVTLAYPSETVTQITTYVSPSLSATRSYNFQVSWGIKRLTSISGPACPACGPELQTFDANGNVESRRDWNGNRMNYEYNARNLETVRTEGLASSGNPTAQTRTVRTDWHATFRLPTGIAEPLRITTFTYDEDGTQCGARGALCSKRFQATNDASGAQGFSAATSAERIWTYTYNANGSVLTVNGPRTDIADTAEYEYYANNHADMGKRANVEIFRNTAGHVYRVTDYNAHGQPLAVEDPNGLVTTLAYDARQRLRTRTVGSETTTYDYDRVGQLTRITQPDGSFVSYQYDNAHRLERIADSAGNSITYDLDSAGNRTLERVRDAGNHIVQIRSREFNALNRLVKAFGAEGQTTEYAYDGQGNVLTLKDPLGRQTVHQYDALNRVRHVTSPAPTAAVTQYAYDGRDALVRVEDPRSLATEYTVDGLGNVTKVISPDTGTTNNTYDDAGNLATRKDAKNQITTYAYDALNRVTTMAFHGGSSHTYAYDQGASGLGRLSSITERDALNQTTSALAYAYDQRGRITSETRTIGLTQYVTGYRYDAAGRLDRLTYPSGRTANYAFDAVGRVVGVTTSENGGQAQQVVSNVAYHPFGGVKAYTLGNGQVYSRAIDEDGRIKSYSLGSQSFTIGYNPASRIDYITEFGSPANYVTYEYDELYRLTLAAIPGTQYTYAYDAVGNRVQRTVGSLTEDYPYSTTSNRIASVNVGGVPVRTFGFDSNGSTTWDGLNSYVYDTRGRMVQAVSSVGATMYQINALGQRIKKTPASGDAVVFHYDLQGRLIAETSAIGTLKREVLYLGDIPVAVAQ